MTDQEREAWRSNLSECRCALDMVKDAIGEMFGPLASLQSPEETITRGPEATRDADVIIEGLIRVEARLTSLESGRCRD